MALHKCPRCHKLIAGSLTVCPHCGAHQRPRGKGRHIVVAVVVFLLLGGMVTLLIIVNQIMSQRTAHPVQSTGAPIKAQGFDFTKVKGGMTHKEVVDALGFDGEKLSEITTTQPDAPEGADKKVTAIYQWVSPPDGSRLVAVFTNDVLTERTITTPRP